MFGTTNHPRSGARRRGPSLRGLVVFGLGFIAASMLAGAATGLTGAAATVGSGVLSLLFFAIRVFFFFLLLSFVARLFFRWRFGGRGRGGSRGWSPGPWGPGHHRHRGGPGRRSEWSTGPSDPGTRADGSVWRYRGQPYPADPVDPADPADQRDRADWEESLRKARQEIDDLDAPYQPERTDASGSDAPRS